MNYRSDILHLRPGRKLSGKRLSPHGRSGRRRAASRNQGNWVAAIAGAMTWLRVSSSGGIGDAASVSVNAMDRRPRRGRRRSRNSSKATSDEGPGSNGLRPFSFTASSRRRGPYETGNTSPFKLSNRIGAFGSRLHLIRQRAESQALREGASVCIATWCNGRRSDIGFW